MSRRARVEFEGAVYHVMDRGDRREAIFRDDEDRAKFLSTLGEVCTRTGWRIHAWVLMSNHYHLLVETPEGNLVKGMQWFQSTWTARFNRRHAISGHLFQGRYKAVVVDPKEQSYFAVLSDYIHLNPVRARMIGPEERLFNYRWSSYRWYAASAGRENWFEAGAVLGELGLADTAGGRRRYAERMRERAVEELSGAENQAIAEVRRGWCLGGEGFRERMLGLLESAGEKLGGGRQVDSPVRRSHDEAAAGAILRCALEVLGIEHKALGTMRKGEERKAAIAAVIRERTTVSRAWIARELDLGDVSQVSRCAREDRQTKPYVKKIVEALDKYAHFTD